MATGTPALIAILGAVVSSLSVDLGSVDFSATGAIAYGRFPTPPKYPFAAIDPETVQSDDDVVMGLFEHTVGVYIEAWAPAVLDKTVASVSSGVTLAHDIQRAIHSAHRTSGGALKAQSVRRVNFPDTEIMNTEINGQKIGHVRMRLELTYKTDGGI